MLHALGFGPLADDCEVQEAPESSRYDEQMAKLRRHVADSYAYMYEPPAVPRPRESGIDVPMDRLDTGQFCWDFTTRTLVQRS
jgi:hypothetical protein